MELMNLVIIAAYFGVLIGVLVVLPGAGLLALGRRRRRTARLL